MASDVKTAAGVVTLPTSSGNFDLTIAGVTWTPKAILLLVCQATATDTDTAHGALGAYLTDGTTHYSFSGGSRDNVATTWSNIYISGDSFHHIDARPGASEVTPEATFVSFIAGGVRLNYASGEQPDIAFKAHMILFGGTDLNVKAGREICTQAEDATLTVNVGQDFNLLLFITGGFTSTTTDWNAHWKNRCGPGFGACFKDGSTIVQRSLTAQSDHNAGTTSRDARVRNDRCIMSADFSSGSTGEEEVTTFTGDAGASSEFVLTKRNAGQTTKIGWLALDTGDRAVEVASLDSPTSASSDWNVTSVGFKPQLALLGLGNFQAENTHYTSGADCECMAVGFFTADAEGCVTWAGGDGLGTSNEMSRLSTDAVVTYQESSGFSAMHKLRSPTMESNGFKFTAANIDNADGTTRKWFGVFIEEAGGQAIESALSMDAVLKQQAAGVAALGGTLGLPLAAGLQGGRSADRAAALALGLQDVIGAAASGSLGAGMALPLDLATAARGLARFTAAAPLTADQAIGAQGAALAEATLDLAGRLGVFPGAAAEFGVALDLQARLAGEAGVIAELSGRAEVSLGQGLATAGANELVAAIAAGLGQDLVSQISLEIDATVPLDADLGATAGAAARFQAASGLALRVGAGVLAEALLDAGLGLDSLQLIAADLEQVTLEARAGRTKTIGMRFRTLTVTGGRARESGATSRRGSAGEGGRVHSEGPGRRDKTIT